MSLPSTEAFFSIQLEVIIINIVELMSYGSFTWIPNRSVSDNVRSCIFCYSYNIIYSSKRRNFYRETHISYGEKFGKTFLNNTLLFRAFTIRNRFCWNVFCFYICKKMLTEKEAREEEKKKRKYIKKSNRFMFPSLHSIFTRKSACSIFSIFECQLKWIGMSA